MRASKVLGTMILAAVFVIFPFDIVLADDYEIYLVGCWNFDEGEGDIVKDSSPNGNHGKIMGGTWVKGLSGFALQLDGTDDYVVCGNDESLNITDEITIEAWAKPLDICTRYAELVAKTEDYQGYSLNMGPQGTTVQLILGCGTEVFGPAYDWSSDYTKWYHIVVSWDGKYIRLFVNGKDTPDMRTDEPVTMEEPIKITTNNLQIGKHHRLESYFNGIIDKVAIYNKALPAGEIKKRYDAWKILNN